MNTRCTRMLVELNGMISALRVLRNVLCNQKQTVVEVVTHRQSRGESGIGSGFTPALHNCVTDGFMHSQPICMLSTPPRFGNTTGNCNASDHKAQSNAITHDVWMLACAFGETAPAADNGNKLTDH